MKNIPAWQQVDATMLRNYLAENPKLIVTLKARRPKLAGTTLEQAAMNAKIAEGYEEMLAHLEELAEPRKEDTGAAQFVDVEKD